MIYGGSKLGSDDFNRPEQTYQDKLTEEDIREKLFNYKKVDDIYRVPLGTHLRYFLQNNDGSTKFRLGGMLYRSDGLPNYVVLSNGSRSWSVQVDNAVFFKKKHERELITEIKDLEELNSELKSLVKKYKKDMKELESEFIQKYTDIEKENKELKKIIKKINKKI